MKSSGTRSCHSERKSRLRLLTKLQRRPSDDVNRSILCRLVSFPQHARRALTPDNGSENAGHERVSRSLWTSSVSLLIWCCTSRLNAGRKEKPSRYIP
jgi:IS30 family transposase